MIVVFGSLNADFFMQVDKLPQPGETVLGGRYFLVPGGKGANQALAAARAGNGNRVAMVGKVGKDEWGDFATSLLRETGVDIENVGRGETGTACASIMVDDKGENAIAVASGANLEARADQVPDELLGPETWLVMQMEVTAKENWALIERAKAAGTKILLSVAPAAPVPPETLAKVDILVVNEIEARMVGEAEKIFVEDTAEIGETLAGRYGLTCIVTLGGEGAAAYSPEGALAVATLPVTPVDTTGAGDAFVGGLATALDEGKTLQEALRFAAVTAGVCCTREGTQSSFGQRSEIDARLKEVLPAQIVGGSGMQG